MDYLLMSADELLERVDEYTLYCSYLGFEPIIGAKYLSPVRGDMRKVDNDPSWGMYERKFGRGNHEFMWKDQAFGIHGDIFDLVKYMCQFDNRRSAIQQVLIDIGEVPGNASRPIIDQREKKFLGCSNITIASYPQMTAQGKAFWKKYQVITPEILSMYNVTQLKMFWLYDEQEFPRYPKTTAFAYRIWDKYQLYFPYEEKKRKFRHDYTDVCVPGYLQLKYNADTLIITKSKKDVMLLRGFGYEAISPRSENTLLPKECLELMKKRYKTILVLFDNDMRHKGDEYEFPKVYVPIITQGDKDPSDFIVNHGAQQTAEMLRQIISI